MVGVDPEVTSAGLRVWIAAGAAALLVAMAARAAVHARASAATALQRVGGTAAAAALGALTAWALIARPGARDSDAERQALQNRAQELAMRALAPGSALACLDGVAGASVEAACERALFASPAAVAAATSYSAARLALVADMVTYERAGGAGIDATLRRLRKSVATDHFGFLAHALAVRDGCTGEKCPALDVLDDSHQVRAHLSGGTLDHYLDHYLPLWAQASDAASAEPAAGQAAASPSTEAPHKLVNIDFPSAASIPPISIMNPEPGTKPSAVAAHATAPSASPPFRKPRKDAAKSAAPAEAQVDPVWTPAPSAPPAQAAASAPVGSSAGAPVPLSPFAPQ